MAKPKRSHGAFAPEGGIVLDALDMAILAALPDEGSKIGKYLAEAIPVARLRAIVDPAVSPGTYGSRLRLLMGEGYVVTVLRRSPKGWQRTKKGRLAAGISDSG